MSRPPPLTVVRGPAAAIRRHPALIPSPVTIVVERRGELPLPWGGLRQVVAGLRARLGDLAVARALAPHRAALGLVLRRLDVSLTPAERAARRELAASVASFVAADPRATAPLREAWTAALGALLDQAPVRIAIPDPPALDAETLAVLPALLGREPAIAGISLGYPDGAACPLLALDAVDRVTVDAGGTDQPAEGRTAVDAIDPLDDDLEHRAWTALAAGRQIDDRTAELALVAARAAFACFGFAAAARLATPLCRDDVPLGPSERQEARLVAAVALAAASDRAASGKERGGSLETINSALAAALAAEPDPAQRSRLLTRLAHRQGTGRDQLEHALDLASEAARLATQPEVDADVAGLVEAWALHARAHALALLGRSPEALTDAGNAVAALERARPGLALPAREQALSEIALVDAIAELCWRAGDADAARGWQTLLERVETEHDGNPVRARRRWIAIERAEHHLDRAIAHAEAAVARAAADLDPVGEEELAAVLGDLLYRAGEARPAARRRARVVQLRQRTAGPSAIAAAEIDAALAAWRAGELDDADRWLDSALASGSIAAAARPELIATRAVIAAEGGHADAAEVLLDEAIGQAADSGRRASLVAVALASGDASARLGEPDVAAGAFERARQIAAAAREPMPPRIAVRLWIGGAESGDLARAVDALAAGLDGDSELWWLLRPVLEAVGSDERGGDIDGAALELCERAAGVRADCADALDRLAARRRGR